MWKYIISALVILAVIIGQFSFIHNDYVNQPLYNILMHILGGFGVGMLSSALVQRSSMTLVKKRTIVVASALLAGFVWEITEILFGITGRQLWSASYYSDTLIDLLDDCLGGVFASLFFRRSIEDAKAVTYEDS